MEIQADLSLCLLHHPSAGAGLLSGFLESLYTHAEPVSFEVIVVADGLSQELAAVEREFPDLVILESPGGQAGPSTLNHALRLASGRYLSLWQEGLRFRSGTLPGLLAFLEENPEAGLVAPRIVAADGKVVPSVRTVPSLADLCLLHTPLGRFLPGEGLLRAHLLGNRDHLQDFEAEWLLAEALVLRREVVEELGLFDEGFHLLYADADYCLRARQAGWHLHYLAGAVVCQERAPSCPPKAGRHQGRVLGDCTRFLLKKWLRPAQLPEG